MADAKTFVKSVVAPALPKLSVQLAGAIKYGVGNVNVRVGLAAPAAPVMVKLPAWESLPAVTLATDDVPQPEVRPTLPVTSVVPVMEQDPYIIPGPVFKKRLLKSVFPHSSK